MDIVGVSYYEGHYRGLDLSFMVLVDDGDRYVLYNYFVDRDRTGKAVDSVWVKEGLVRPELFPDAIGKFIPEMISLSEPVHVEELPGYDGMVDMMTRYFSRFGEDFKQ